MHSQLPHLNTGTFIPLASVGRGQPGEATANRQESRGLDEVDEHGDFIFRFRLKPTPAPEDLTQHEFYRQHIHDLLKVVRFHFRGQPVLVDSFSFLNDPTAVFGILPERSPTESRQAIDGAD